MSVKKRRYNNSYIEYRFTCISNNGEERPQCVLCNKVLSNDSSKPTKLKQHLHNVHQQYKDKSRSFFKHHARASCSQLMVFVKYVHLNSFKEELLFLFPSRKNYENRRHFSKSFLFLQIKNFFVGKPMWVLHRRNPSYVRNQIWISSLR